MRLIRWILAAALAVGAVVSAGAIFSPHLRNHAVLSVTVCLDLIFLMAPGESYNPKGPLTPLENWSFGNGMRMGSFAFITFAGGLYLLWLPAQNPPVTYLWVSLIGGTLLGVLTMQVAEETCKALGRTRVRSDGRWGWRRARTC